MKVDETNKGSARLQFFRRALPYVFVFLIALSASLAHNFFEPNTRTIFFADSRNYQKSSNYICSAFFDVINGRDVRPFLRQEHVAARIENDGPILSTFLACIFAVIGHAPESNDWKIFVVIQCIIHSLTAALVVALTMRFVPSARLATLAGIAFALYPGGIIASGRVMTETLSCLLCTAYVLLLLAATKRLIWAPLCGLVGGLAWTIKVVLIPPVVSCLLFLAASRKLKLASLAIVVAGIVVIVSPWAYFSKTFLQRTMITTERASVHNAYIGWDTETDGFQASFPTPKEKMLLVCDPVSVIWGQVLSNPGGCAHLTLEKFARFYGLPFNDFRHSCFGISNLALIPIHLFYLLCGALGIVMYALGGFRRLSADGRLACNLTLVALFFMQCYFLFEANTRYGYTSFAFLTALGAMGLWLLVQLFKEKSWLRLAGGLCTACLLTFLVADSETLVNLGEPKETAHRLLPNEKAVAEIKLSLPGNYRGPDFALVLVDGDEALSSADLKVNGKAVPAKLMPLPYFDSQRYKQFNLMKEYGYGLNVPVEELRQWRAAVIPVSWLHKDGQNSIEIDAKKPLTIYGDSGQNLRRFRSLDAVCVNRLLHEPQGFEARPFEPVLSGRVNKTCTLSTQAGGPQTLSQESLRIHIALLQPLNDSKSSPSVGAEQPVEKVFVQDDFPLLMRVHGTNEITSSKYVVAHSVTSLATPIPPYKEATHARITLTGSVRAAKKDSKAGIAICTGGNSDLFWMLARLPYSIPASTDWKPFVISDLLPMDAFAGRAAQIGIGFYPGPWPEVMGLGHSVAGNQIVLKDLRLKIEPVASIDLHGAQLMVY